MLSAHYKPRFDVTTEQDVFIADGQDFDPQTVAMLQAFYSRSTQSISERVEGMDAEQVKNSLRKFYVNYGHRSIGQCGNFNLFFENVSMFAAKAIQHHPLYNGQETSTRYYNFLERPMVLPYDVPGFEETVRAVYGAITSVVTEKLLERARAEGPVDDVFERAINARAFDISRAFLTAGFTTKLSWTTNFDQVQEHLEWLANCPSRELEALAINTHNLLHKKYPDGIANRDIIDEANTSFMFDDTVSLCGATFSNGRLDMFSPYAFKAKGEQMMNLYSDPAALDFMIRRQRGTPVPKQFAKFGTFQFGFNIDYGSWRDLHRHRNGWVAFPHYNTNWQLHSWYIDQLNELDVMNSRGAFGETIQQNIDRLYKAIENAHEVVSSHHLRDTDTYHAAMMHYVPMGCLVTGFMRYDLPQAIYVAELRSARTVHPTARHVAKAMGKYLRLCVPKEVSIYTDETPDAGPQRRRGQQTILSNETQSAIT